MKDLKSAGERRGAVWVIFVCLIGTPETGKLGTGPMPVLVHALWSHIVQRSAISRLKFRLL